MTDLNIRLKILLILVSGSLTWSASGQINAKKTLQETNHEIISVEFSHDGKYMATIGSDHNVIIWNTETDVIYRTLSGLKKRPNTVVISDDNKKIFSAGEDRIISMWDLLSMKVEKRFEGHKKSIKTIDINPDGTLLASGGEDRVVKIWDVSTGNTVFDLDGHTKDVNDLKFSPDGNQLTSGSADGTIIVWHVPSGRLISKANAHEGWVRCLDYSHDGSFIASGGYDNLIKIWRSDDLSPVKTLTGHANWVQSLSFSPDDQYILSGGHDQLIILWDLQKGEPVIQSPKQGQIVMAVRFYPAKRDFVSATLFSENLKIWSYGMPDIAQIRIPVPSKDTTPPVAEKIDPGDSIQLKIQEMSEAEARITETPQFPSITLFSPVPVSGQVEHDKPNIFLIGKTEDPAGINVFLVNKEVATLSEAGVFQYNLDLKPGLNEIELVAINNDGKMNTSRLVIDCTSEAGMPLSNREPSGIKGKFYALIMGVNEYQDPNITNLDNPIQDAERFYNVIVNRYTFNPEDIIFLKNPTRMDMIMALDDYSRKVTPDDNLLIFYAGHGFWEEKTGVGYWLPSDASKSNSVNWFRNSTLRDFIGSIQSKHTMLIADACFSGAIFKTRAAFTETSAGIQKLYELPSRKAMTSGNTGEEVPDNSVFLKYLVSRLEENEDPFLPSEVLFGSFKPAVLNNSPNVPVFGTIQNVGDEGGDFIFILK